MALSRPLIEQIVFNRKVGMFKQEAAIGTIVISPSIYRLGRSGSVELRTLSTTVGPCNDLSQLPVCPAQHCFGLKLHRQGSQARDPRPCITGHANLRQFTFHHISCQESSPAQSRLPWGNTALRHFSWLRHEQICLLERSLWLLGGINWKRIKLKGIQKETKLTNYKKGGKGTSGSVFPVCPAPATVNFMWSRW